MIDADHARRFAVEWIDAWNAHDLERILAHYADDFEMASPVIAQVAGEPSGVLRGKANVAAYWKKALALMPDLHFTLERVLAGAESVAIAYRGHRGASVEVFWFGADGRVVRAAAHYEV
jgi:ketosteroid isomerase-like protein